MHNTKAYNKHCSKAAAAGGVEGGGGTSLGLDLVDSVLLHDSQNNILDGLKKGL